MQIPTDNLNGLSGPVIFIGGDASAARPCADAEGHASGCLIDWNICSPDGTDASLRGALSSIANAFRGDVDAGLCAEGRQLEQHASRPVADREHQSAIRSALVEAIQSKEACLFATVAGQSSLVLQQMRRMIDVPLVLGLGCRGPGSASDSWEVGLVVSVARAEQLQNSGSYAALIAQTQREFPKWLQIWLNCRSAGRLSRWKRRLSFYRQRRGRLSVLAVGLLLASMAIPLPYWPQRPCVVEPEKKCYVSSPIDGRVRGATVRPGDTVSAGQLLARLDAEQLQWQLAAAEAEYEAASKKRDTALATRAGGELRLAQLEQERIAVQLESLQRQLERLELRSPTAGVVVQGEWFQSDGAPVSRGDMLFEIAEMDRMRVEIHLSTDDLARIAVGDQATVRVDAAPGAKWSSQLTRIDPRGVVVDSAVVFGATIEVANDTNQLRPGMKGTARISAGYQTLGWLLFHRPAMWAMKKLAW